MSTVLETRDPMVANFSNVPPSPAIALPTLSAVERPVRQRTIFTTPESRIGARASAAPGCRVDDGWTAQSGRGPSLVLILGACADER